MRPCASPCIPVHPCAPVNPRASPCIPVHPHASPCIPVHPCAPVNPRASPCIPVHPHASPCIPVHPCAPAQLLRSQEGAGSLPMLARCSRSHRNALAPSAFPARFLRNRYLG
ncbi:PREDICTED: glutelin-2-like [Tinamus guttatus]|uniref:glutelin-2-like n=1 Tax=Tinamus guttatus TaxID=94827 RepID=UPI00052F2F7F|nr:PREDICTED: glutelin-2-like [Tinamus guttatus]